MTVGRLDVVRFLCPNGHVTVKWALEGPAVRCAKCGSTQLDQIEEVDDDDR